MQTFRLCFAGTSELRGIIILLIFSSVLYLNNIAPNACEVTSFTRTGPPNNPSTAVRPPINPMVSSSGSDSRAARIAAPRATASSGLTPNSGVLPVTFSSICRTAGIRVEPPTRRTLSICAQVSCASCRTSSKISSVRRNNPAICASNIPRFTGTR